LVVYGSIGAFPFELSDRPGLPNCVVDGALQFEEPETSLGTYKQCVDGQAQQGEVEPGSPTKFFHEDSKPDHFEEWKDWLPRQFKFEENPDPCL